MKELKLIDAKITTILKHFEEENSVQELNTDWHFAAKVLDRLFLWISIIYAVVSFTGIILTIKNIYS